MPYLEGDRTPNRPDATGALHGLTLRTSTPTHMARAAIEGLLCGLADGLDALERHGARINRIILVGGGARSEALRLIAPSILGHPVAVPSPGEYVANGAAIQAAWVISDAPHPPSWGTADAQLYEGDAIPAIRERYAAARDLTVPQRRTGRSPDDSER